MDSFEEVERVRVSPLTWLLIRSNTDDLLHFIDKLHLDLSSKPLGKGKVGVRLKSIGGFECESDGEGFKSALVRALAIFLCTEQRDYHEVIKANRHDRD
jgi:hypothetical protein